MLRRRVHVRYDAFDMPCYAASDTPIFTPPCLSPCHDTLFIYAARRRAAADANMAYYASPYAAV